ncbi:hypothetical protein BGX34_008125 [Mortierella sp. NVP85]|nr:hypothetical protein BGX34_008125 [Mortierella sp. NVP85]
MENMEERSPEERSPNERNLQEFYFHSPVDPLSTPETVTIPARWDTETGYHVVLLDDAQVVIKDAVCFARSGCIIPFMKDNDSQELIPLRIKYCQGAILEIVADTLLAHIKRYEPYIESMMSSQETGMSGFHDSIEELTESMSQGASDDKKQVLQMKELVDEWASAEQKDQEAQSNRQEMEQHMLEKQQRILQDQQRSIDRLVTIQERIQDTMALTFSVQVNPFPRFFIVLPIRLSRWSTLDEFRIFFLCEHCDPAKISSPTIHLARHEGYKLADVDRFFEIYGLYVVLMTRILKNGITSPGLNIPCLSHLTLADGVKEVQGVLKLETNTIQSLMNDTISYIRNKGYDASMFRMSNEAALDLLESTVVMPDVEYLENFPSQGLLTVSAIMRDDSQEMILMQEQTPRKMNQALADIVRWEHAKHFNNRQCEVAEDHQDEDTDEEERKDTVDAKEQRLLDKLVEVAETRGSQDIAETSREKAGVVLGGKVEQEPTTLVEAFRPFADIDSNMREALFDYSDLEVGPQDITETAREKAGVALGGKVEQEPTTLEEAFTLFADIDLNMGETALFDFSGLEVGSQDITETAREKAGVALGGKVEQEPTTLEEAFTLFTDIDLNMGETALFDYNDLDDGPWGIRWIAREKAVIALRGKAEQEVTALQKLIGAASDPHESVREAAVRALRGPSKVSHAALEAVIKAVMDREWNVQEAAVQVLGDQPQLPVDLVTILLDTAGSKHLHVMRAVKDTLARHASSRPICQRLIFILLNGAIAEKKVAVEVLATLVKLPESATEALITTLEDDDQDIRSSAVHTLQYQSELSELAIQSLVMMAREGTLDVSQAAIRVLDSQISVSGSVIPALIKCLEDASEDIRIAAVQGLRDNYELPPWSTVRHLVGVLSQGRVKIREILAEILEGQVTLSEAMKQALIKSPNNDPIVKETSVQGSGSQVELPQAVIDALVPKDRGPEAEKTVASSLLDFFTVLQEQEPKAVIQEEQNTPEMETPETLRRERANILQRTATNSSEMIDFEAFTNIQWLTDTGRVAKRSSLRVVLKGHPISREGEERFDQELEILRCIRNHDYIVPFYGVTTDPSTNARYIVKKYCKNGNLTSFLEKHHEDLTWLERYRICIEVAEGLEFLHNSGFYHRNLHSGNVLLDDKRTAMLCDFGLDPFSSRDQTIEAASTVRVTPFLAPERFPAQRPVYTAACDIYSLGMIFWHVSSGRIPFASQMSGSALINELMNGLREKIVPRTPREFQNLIVKCWDAQPFRRPKIDVVNRILQTLMAKPSERVHLKRSEKTSKALPVPTDLDSKMASLERASNTLYRRVFNPQNPVMRETVDYIERTRAYFKKRGSSQEPYSLSNPPKTPIYMCPILGDIAALRYHLSKSRYCSEPINESSEQTGDTALHLACLFLESPMDTIQVLVDLGADVNQKNLQGYTPIMILVSSKSRSRYEAVKYLRRCGARIPAYIPSPITPHDSAQLYAINFVNESREFTLSGGDASPAQGTLNTRQKRSRLDVMWNTTRARPLIHVVAAMQDDERILDCLYGAGLDPALSSAEETALVAAAAHLKIKNIQWLLNNDLEISTEANILKAIEVVKALRVNRFLAVNPQQESGAFSPLTDVGGTSRSVSQEYLNSVRDLRKYSWKGIASAKAADRLGEDMVGPVLDLLEQWTGDRRIVNRKYVAANLKPRIPSGQKDQRYLIDQVLKGNDA